MDIKERVSYANRTNLIMEYRLAIKEPVTPEWIHELSGPKENGEYWAARLHFRLRTYPSFEEIPELPELKDGEAVYVRQGTTTYSFYWLPDLGYYMRGGQIEDKFYGG